MNDNENPTLKRHKRKLRGLDDFRAKLRALEGQLRRSNKEGVENPHPNVIGELLNDKELMKWCRENLDDVQDIFDLYLQSPTVSLQGVKEFWLQLPSLFTRERTVFSQGNKTLPLEKRVKWPYSPLQPLCSNILADLATVKYVDGVASRKALHQGTFPFGQNVLHALINTFERANLCSTSASQQTKIWDLLYEKILYYSQLENRLAGESNRGRNSGTPLYCLCRNVRYHGLSPPLKIFQFLVNANPQTLSAGAETPLDFLIRPGDHLRFCNPTLFPKVFDFFLSVLDNEEVQRYPSLDHACWVIPFSKMPNDGLRMLKLLVARSPESPSSFDPAGTRPLHYACMNPNVTVEVVEYLFEQYPQAIMQCNRNGRFPLHDAAERSIDVLKFIYKKFPSAAKVRSQKSHPRSHQSTASYPFQRAFASTDGADAVKLLYQWHPEAATSDHSRKFLVHDACRVCASKDTLTFLETLTSGKPYSQTDKDGKMPLHHLCLYYGYYSHTGPSLDLVKFVVEKAPHAVKHRDNDGYLPLHEMFRNVMRPEVDESVLLYLIDLYPGAAAPWPDGSGSCFHNLFGFKKPYLSLIQVLIQKLPEVLGLKDDYGMLPIHQAFSRMKTCREIVKCLVDADPLSLYARDNQGQQPIHLACQIGPISVFNMEGDLPDINEAFFEVYRKREGPLLLGILANPEIKNIDGVVEFMLRNFPRLSLVGGNEHGETAFHFAAARVFQPELIRALAALDHSMLGVTDENGNLPLHIAANNCNLAAIEYVLKERGERDLKVPNKQNMYPLFLVCQGPSTPNANYKSVRHLDVIWQMTKAFPDLFSNK